MVKVCLQVTHGHVKTRDPFCDRYKAFPAAVAMSNATNFSCPLNATISAEEVDAIVSGLATPAPGEVLHGRDAEHATMQLEYIRGLPEHERLGKWDHWLRSNVTKMRGRAQGNAGFVNVRVAEYARHAMDAQFADQSKKDCRRTFELSRQFAAACPFHQATLVVQSILKSSNDSGWKLRSGNLFTLWQLVKSDTMHSISFYGERVEGALNGIGATLFVRDGGGAYRHLLRNREQQGEMSKFAQIYFKLNGTGFDKASNEAINALSPRIYEAMCTTGTSIFEEVRSSSAQGFLAKICDVVEKSPGAPEEVVSRIDSLGLRLYMPEVDASGSSQSMNTLTALNHMITRNTTKDGASGKIESTRASADTNQRVHISYNKQLDGVMSFCTNEAR